MKAIFFFNNLKRIVII